MDNGEKILLLVQSIDKRLYGLEERHDERFGSIEHRLASIERELNNVKAGNYCILLAQDGKTPEVLIRMLQELQRTQEALDKVVDSLEGKLQ